MPMEMTGVPRKPVLLIILDGFGVNPAKTHNAIAAAQTPHLDYWFSRHPTALLQASGLAVGLPDGQMGNSEVGHITLGCGAILRQDIVRINAAISSGEFFEQPIFHHAITKALSRRRPVHLFGLVSDGGVHSHIHHLLALIKMCRQRGAVPLLHMVTDGRDTPPRAALSYLPAVEAALHEAHGGIATVMGRYYGMDRDKRWDRTALAWRAIVLGQGDIAESAADAINAAYANGVGDEFIRPTVLPLAQPILAGDQVISFNFRKDRPRQTVAALAKDDFQAFDRSDAPRPEVTCLMQYDQTLNLPYVFEPERPTATLAQVVSEAGLRQFHCAETEKYAHVTYFFNGGRHEAWPGETQMLIPSSQVATYDLKPEMSAAAVADATIDAVNSGDYGFLLVNFANGDMVGHTAVREAVIKAVETLDREVGRLLHAATAKGYSVILTADHGNCELLVDPVTGEPHTQHTTFPVPCMIVDDTPWVLSCEGGLSNIAPTVLQLLGLPKPATMPAASLLVQPATVAASPSAKRALSAA